MDHAVTGHSHIPHVAPAAEAVGAPAGLAVSLPMGRPARRLLAHLRLLRPRHWVKGAPVVLAPLVVAPAETVASGPVVATTLLAFLLASSTVYTLNDLRDRAADRLHPVKRHRPLASGDVAVPTAYAMLAVLALATGVLLLALPWPVALVVVLYVALNVGYSLALKRRPLVDVSVVAAGFSLRVLAGTLAAGLVVQPFLLLGVYCACAALALGKRRHELAGAEDGAAARHRPALAAYSVPFLDHVVVVNLVAALVGYVGFVWVLTPYGATAAVLTFPLATFAVHRYLQMIMVERSGGDPVEDLVRDRPLQGALGLWAAVLVPLVVAGQL